MTHNPPYKYIYIASCHKNGGIYRYQLMDNAALHYLDHVVLDRVMYMVIREDKMYVLLREPFAASKESGLVIFQIEKDGRLTNPGEIISTEGEVACHLAVLGKEQIYVANYISGSISYVKNRLVRHRGIGIHPDRQNSPHTHHITITPDQKYLCVTDLGLDKIILYDKELKVKSSVSLDAGAGPRHLIFSKDGRYAYCVNELHSTVTVLSYREGVMVKEETFDAFAKEDKKDNTSAAVRLSKDGRELFVSNRGHDSVSQFHIEKNQLKWVTNIKTGGKGPRDFELISEDSKLICLNETSNDVTVIERQSAQNPAIIHKLELQAPVCVVMKEV